MWFRGGLDNVRLMVGTDDLEGLFQPKLFYDCMILWLCRDTARGAHQHPWAVVAAKPTLHPAREGMKLL